MQHKVFHSTQSMLKNLEIRFQFFEEKNSKIIFKKKIFDKNNN